MKIENRNWINQEKKAWNAAFYSLLSFSKFCSFYLFVGTYNHWKIGSIHEIESNREGRRSREKKKKQNKELGRMASFLHFCVCNFSSFLLVSSHISGSMTVQLPHDAIAYTFEPNNSHKMSEFFFSILSLFFGSSFALAEEKMKDKKAKLMHSRLAVSIRIFFFSLR